MFEASQPHFFANLFGYNRIFTTFLPKYLVVTEFLNSTTMRTLLRAGG
jgi:hypothetical protein